MKTFVRKHKLALAISIFLVVFSAIHYIKPAALYNQDGGFRPFGLGYKHKTVIPIWLIAILVAIFSYLGVVSYIQYT
jgi:hypothetical protein